MEQKNTTFHDAKTEDGIRRRVQTANIIATTLGPELHDRSLDEMAADIGRQIGSLDILESGERLTSRQIPVADQSKEAIEIPVKTQAA